MSETNYRCSVKARFICARLLAADVLVGGGVTVDSAVVYSVESSVDKIVTDDDMLSVMSYTADCGSAAAVSYACQLNSGAQAANTPAELVV
jgi:hypothetical protein